MRGQDNEAPPWHLLPSDRNRPPANFPALDCDKRADIAVIAAACPAAYLLAKACKRVIVLERLAVALAEMGHTTPHLAYVVDTRLSNLLCMRGEEGTKAPRTAGAYVPMSWSRALASGSSAGRISMTFFPVSMPWMRAGMASGSMRS